MRGGAPRAVWLTLDADPRLISALSAAQRLNQLGRPCHLVWNPLTGETVQLLPIVRAGCSLGLGDDTCWEGNTSPIAADPYATGPRAAPQPDDAAGVNTEGRLCLQLGVVAFGREPFTSGPVLGLAPIMDWIDSWGVARRWPAGPPDAYAHAHQAVRCRRLWARGGHYGASQVPGCTAAGPGAINVEMLTGRSSGVPADRQRPRAGSAPPRPRPAALSPMGGAGDEDEPADALARAG